MAVRVHSKRAVSYIHPGMKPGARYGHSPTLGHRSTGHEADCSLCGYPVTAVMGSVVHGDGVRHVLCPSLSERRKMRQATLENA